jgi:indole-3-glycerol phosphate synthase
MSSLREYNDLSLRERSLIGINNRDTKIFLIKILRSKSIPNSKKMMILKTLIDDYGDFLQLKKLYLLNVNRAIDIIKTI